MWEEKNRLGIKQAGVVGDLIDGFTGYKASAIAAIRSEVGLPMTEAVLNNIFKDSGVEAANHVDEIMAVRADLKNT